MHQRRSLLLGLPILAAVLILVACDNTPPTTNISFSKQVQPILAQNCLECHDTKGAGAEASGLELSSYETLMKGTKFGPVIKPGDSLSSTLAILIEGRADSAINMPHGDRPPLSKEEIQTLRQWIDQGANNN